MFNRPLQQAVGVAAGSIATIQIPVEDLTLLGVKLKCSGTTFDKTKIERVRVKVGSRTIWDLTYDQINKINNYKNAADNLSYLYLDFTERDQALFPMKAMGGLDLLTLSNIGQVTLEVYVAATAVAPALKAIGYFDGGQGNPAVLKYVNFTAAYNVGGKFTLPITLKGAVLKRIFIFFSGTAFTPTANGNVEQVECKKNGLVFFDQSDLDNRFDQAHYKKVPQAGVYVCDFIVDNNAEAVITSMRKVGDNLVYDTFEIGATLKDAGGSSLSIIAEVYDSVTNL